MYVDLLRMSPAMGMEKKKMEQLAMQGIALCGEDRLIVQHILRYVAPWEQ